MSPRTKQTGALRDPTIGLERLTIIQALRSCSMQETAQGILGGKIRACDVPGRLTVSVIVFVKCDHWGMHRHVSTTLIQVNDLIALVVNKKMLSAGRGHFGNYRLAEKTNNF